MSMERVLRQQRRYAEVVREELLKNTPPPETSPEIDRLVTEIIGRVADKWTMLVIEVLSEHGELRFTRIAELLEGISQKMLTKTLRQMERDGLVERTVHPVVPPHVEYRLTTLGASLSAAFCGVWMWAEKYHDDIVRARERFDATPAPGVPRPRVVVTRGNRAD
jgi:DNA-binding HxlR family transcriptional regulator